jgi:STE24 endopeptidase
MWTKQTKWAVTALLLLTLTAGHSAWAQQLSVTIPPPDAHRQTYHRIYLGLYFGGSVWGWIGLWWLFRAGWVQQAVTRAAVRTTKPEWQVASAFMVCSFFLLAWRLPVAAVGHFVERSFGFSVMPFSAWLGERMMRWAIGWWQLGAALLVYALLRRYPKGWWRPAALAASVWLVFSVLIYPVVVEPMFDRFTELPEGPVRTGIMDLARSAGLDNPRILVAEMSRRTTKLNAYVTGIGPTARIVLWDNLLKAAPEDEILAVVGHELGHYAERHIVWGTLLGIAATWALMPLTAMLLPKVCRRLGLSGPADPAGLPVLLLFISMLMFFQAPAEAAVSRWFERRADVYGLRLTNLRDATARIMVRFVEANYAEPDPVPLAYYWFHTHPPIRERVERALQFHP